MICRRPRYDTRVSRTEGCGQGVGQIIYNSASVIVDWFESVVVLMVDAGWWREFPNVHHQRCHQDGWPHDGRRVERRRCRHLLTVHELGCKQSEVGQSHFCQAYGVAIPSTGVPDFGRSFDRMSMERCKHVAREFDRGDNFQYCVLHKEG